MPDTSSESKRKRYGLQFRLRTLLVLVAVCCVWFGWHTHQARKQRKTVTAIKELGGRVLYDYEIDDQGHIMAEVNAPAPDWVREIVGIDFVDDVAVVDTSTSDYERVGELKGLRGLSIRSATFRDLKPLAGLRDLKWLNLQFTKVSDLTPIVELKDLFKASLLKLSLHSILVGFTGRQLLQDFFGCWLLVHGLIQRGTDYVGSSF